VLEALAEKLNADATVGDVLDAADNLGWGEQLGGFSLAELASVLLKPPLTVAPSLPVEPEGPALSAPTERLDSNEEEDDASAADEASAEDDIEDDEREAWVDPDDVVVEERSEKTKRKQVAAAKSIKKTKHGSRSSSGTTKKATKAIAAAPKAFERKPIKKVGAHKKAARLRALKRKIDAEERMSLDEAAELFVPIVTELRQATMQDLEENTGVGRRKLRFHVGQLVRHGYLDRHGMGRGTYYTVKD